MSLLGLLSIYVIYGSVREVLKDRKGEGEAGEGEAGEGEPTLEAYRHWRRRLRDECVCHRATSADPVWKWEES
jgi:hypothetical protein